MNEHLRAIGAHARELFPVECCGYITDRVVRCTNALASETRFEIAGAELFAFAQAFEAAVPPRVVYHSHTNGRAYFSEADRALASYPVDHLVIGVTASGLTEAALFRAGDFVEIARWPAEVLG